MSKAAAPIAPELLATAADLLYVTDETPGLTRRRAGRGFMYLDPQGQHVKAPDIKARIAALAIPPAWTQVWICADPQGHIQATGRDEAGRKQYIYHARWCEVRDQNKFSQMIDFARCLPTLRARYDSDMRQSALNQSRVLAIAVRLLDLAMLRIGNDANVREDGGHGLTTLTPDHVDLSTSVVEVDFIGKSGIERHVTIHDRRLASQIKRCVELGGFKLFNYVDASGHVHPICSSHVNAYLKEITERPFTAKYFRTWGGTRAAAQSLLSQPRPDDDAEREAHIQAAIGAASQALGNTVAICRKYYIHPALFDAYRTFDAWPVIDDTHAPTPLPQLSPTESFILKLLEERADPS